MHLKNFASAVTLSLLTSGARAAEVSAASATAPVVVVPSTPAPSIAATATPAPAAAPNQIVYTPRLPTAAELTSAAAAQGLSVERIEQSSTQILATYKMSNGQTNVVSYQTLPPAGTSPANYTTTVPVTPPPTIVYERPAARVVYYDDPFYYPYYPRIWYPPVSVSLGFGFGHGFGHGGGGFRHGR